MECMREVTLLRDLYITLLERSSQVHVTEKYKKKSTKISRGNEISPNLIIINLKK